MKFILTVRFNQGRVGTSGKIVWKLRNVWKSGKSGNCLEF